MYKTAVGVERPILETEHDDRELGKNDKYVA